MTALRELNLIIVLINNIDHVGEVDVNRMDDAICFPVLLNLADTETGRPGYLHHMAELRDLRDLRWSICVNMAETNVTMGWAEAICMGELAPT